MKQSNQFSRRKFLSVTAGASAVGVPLFIPSCGHIKHGRPGANERLTVAVIGVGGMGSRHLRNMKKFQADGIVNIAAVCDIDENRLRLAVRKAGPGVVPYRDYRYILERRDIDAVVISTPDHWHAVQMVHSAECGKHVYVEKPACCTIEEGKAMIAAAGKNKVSVQVGSQGRSQREAYLIHRYLASGEIGRINKVECFHPASKEDTMPVPDSAPPPELDWDLWLGPLWWRPFNSQYCHKTFRWVLESGGGNIRDRGAHVMSCAMWWMGADGTGPVTVEATGTSPPIGLWDSAMTMKVTYTFKNPDWTLIWSQEMGNAVPEETRSGKKRRRGEGINFGAIYYGTKGKIVHWGGDGRVKAQKKVLEWKPHSGAADVYKSPGHMKDWFKSIKTGSKPIMNIEAGVGVANLCNLGNIAFILGRKIKWDQTKQEITGDEQARRMMSRPQRHPYHL